MGAGRGGGDAGRAREQSRDDRLLVPVLSWWLTDISMLDVGFHSAYLASDKVRVQHDGV